MILWIIVAIIVLVVIWFIATYNGLIRLKNQTDEAWSDIDVQLKRRYDLIPNLVETARAYMSHERETLEAVIAARNAAASGLAAAAANPSSAVAIRDLSGQEGALGAALGRLNVVMEAYPDLKANQNMMQLTEELTSTENKVAFARQAFNDQVMAYNTYKQSFPPVIVATIFGHGADATLLKFEDSAQIQAAPKVSF